MSRAFSVVVPAHQEQATIGRCLSALTAGLPADAEVVVVANGCVDATAERARAFPVTVLDLAEGGKAGALDAGDAACTAFPRVYVDADVVLSSQSLLALVAALEPDRPLLATPSRQLELTGATPVVRAYYRTWARLQECRGDHLGGGVYAVNAPGRARWQRFPAGIADDYHVHSRFAPEERLRVTAAVSVVRPPRSLSSLLGVRARVYAGNLEHSADRGTMRRARPTWTPLLRDPAALAAAPVYLAVTLLAKRAARRRLRTGATHWAQDLSGRGA